ncbi:hypothetical protein ACAG26_06105 [Mycobacterium sp. pUA109]|uniref:hypothetical protein n=1 Tax=Mycobacterium sp. pUA109 TaxID=3238982 RepID=UPI00351BA65F
MTLKSLATGVAAVAAIGAAAAGVTSIASVSPAASEVQPVVFGIPVPLDPAPDVPAPDELIGLLNNLADPGVPFASKSGLVEGGIGPIEAHAADKRLQKAAQKGQLPLQFSVANIAPSGPGTATANVTASGPQMAPRTLAVSFVNQDGWKLSRSSAMSLLQAASAG